MGLPRSRQPTADIIQVLADQKILSEMLTI
jgi:hypothetical protein